MDKFKIFFSAVLIISTVTQTYSAPAVKSPKPVELPRRDPVKNDISSTFQDGGLENSHQSSVITNFKAERKSPEVLEGDIHSETAKNSKPKPSDINNSPIDLSMKSNKRSQSPSQSDGWSQDVQSPYKKMRNNGGDAVKTKKGESFEVPDRQLKFDASVAFPVIYPTLVKFRVRDSDGRSRILESYSFNTVSGIKRILYISEVVEREYLAAGKREMTFRALNGNTYKWEYLGDTF